MLWKSAIFYGGRCYKAIYANTDLDSEDKIVMLILSSLTPINDPVKNQLISTKKLSKYTSLQRNILIDSINSLVGMDYIEIIDIFNKGDSEKEYFEYKLRTSIFDEYQEYLDDNDEYASQYLKDNGGDDE